jgi:hypothetical protein
VNRKEYTVGLKVFLLLIISAAWAVSIEFPSLGFSHPNYPSSVRMSVDDLKGHSAVSIDAANAISKMSAGDLSERDLGNINLFPYVPRSDLIESPSFVFPSFMLSDPDTNAAHGASHPNTNPVDPQPQDLTSHSKSSPSLSEFYLKKPHE